VKVKICGIQTVEHALAAEKAGADALGFMFAESKRRIIPEKAKRIISKLEGEIWRVGVFVNEEVETVKHVAQYCGLTAIQLHGEEKPADYLEVGLPIIKSIGVKPAQADLDVGDVQHADYILLDAAAREYSGGNGVAFDWEKVRGLGAEYPTIILAGGLNPENVRVAIEVVNPFMVDVSSGVEVNGRKNTRRIFEFIKMAKEGAIK
jgi:phosphoribosylanthranilate isomerase